MWTFRISNAAYTHSVKSKVSGQTITLEKRYIVEIWSLFWEAFVLKPQKKKAHDVTYQTNIYIRTWKNIKNTVRFLILICSKEKKEMAEKNKKEKIISD